MSEGPKVWCVYLLVDPRTGKPFYVGCTSNPKTRCKQHKYDQSAGRRYDRIKEIHAAGLKCIMRIIGRFGVKYDALDVEYHLIKKLPNQPGIYLLNGNAGQREGAWSAKTDPEWQAWKQEAKVRGVTFLSVLAEHLH